MSKEEDEFLTYDQASKLLNVSRSTLYGLVAKKRVPHIRVGRRFVRFNADALRKWFREKMVEINNVNNEKCE